uniref:C-type lectin domain-containing protein n=1 Tax=Callorhinchus milii TaxID=7868 RepID=A0A4W3HMZ9_CALMI
INCLFPALPQTVPSLDRKYHMINEKKQWAEARDHCRTHSTDLVSIRSPEETDVTARLISKEESYWIGLYNNNLTAVGWQWSNGDAFNYTHWKDKKMNSYSASVICVAMNNGLWFDGYCNQTYWFICYDVWGSRNKLVDREYYPINQLKNWSEARDYCRSHYTDLVSIRSPEEAKRTSQMIVSDRILWIGLFSKKGSTAEWMWTNGEEVNYTHWKFMQPNDYLNSDICVAVISDLALKNRSVNRMYYMIDQEKNWTEALNYCQVHYTNMISIQSYEEDRFISKKFDNIVPLWIGLYNKKGSKANWMWATGEQLNYAHWKFMEPNGYLSSPVCVAVSNGLAVKANSITAFKNAVDGYLRRTGLQVIGKGPGSGIDINCSIQRATQTRWAEWPRFVLYDSMIL